MTDTILPKRSIRDMSDRDLRLMLYRQNATLLRRIPSLAHKTNDSLCFTLEWISSIASHQTLIYAETEHSALLEACNYLGITHE